jgi:DNA adenine methylase
MPDPFLKWAGGKRWLVHTYRHLLPQRVGRYIEPFLGSAAVFFSIEPQSAILADKNVDLINAFSAIKSAPKSVEKLLCRYHTLHGKKFYYDMRRSEPRTPVTRAARFIYLNRTCFNGLYRVNEQGRFNVPMGSKRRVQYAKDHLSQISEALRHATLCVSDFEPIVDKAGEGDFLYIDPPYTVKHNNNNFIKYNDVLFQWGDQVRLAAAVRRAVQRGALVMISNADHECVRTLYSRYWHQTRVERQSVLAADSLKRNHTTELVITSYRTE